MNLLRSQILRLPIVLIGALAWLAISNHCAIGALKGAAEMPMRGCHGAASSEQSPAKQDEKAGTECCKVLRATLLTPSQSLLTADLIVASAHDLFVELVSAAAEARAIRLIEWDTGPPEINSFAETVLQRSILAHAPPLSRS